MSNVPVAVAAPPPACTPNQDPDSGAKAKAKALGTSLPDAGMRGLDHYSRKLPRWRHRIRQRLLPIVRWETPYLAKFQQACRTPALDSYFAVTANLGTHTFFMTALPICFWCGYTGLGRALVHMLALGVFWSGWIKDLLCLPRPLSPPLQRITMSGSAALEYGFPSTHSTNAVSVAFYFLHQLHNIPDYAPSPQRNLFLFFGYCYAASIIIGRMYCGMHGFFDVVIGSLLGALFGAIQLAYGDAFDAWVAAGNWTTLLVVVAALLLAVRFHPEPADNCPCFDDSVAFAGVLIGCQIGHWHFSGHKMSDLNYPPATVYYSLDDLGWAKTFARILGGVVIIFLWRGAMKPLLLRTLPPLFRTIESHGLTLPRRFFTRASEYKRVPPLRQDDNVIPSAQDIPGIISNLRTGRKRGVSVGPQSEADAREFIAFREKKRRDSRSSQDGTAPLNQLDGTSSRQSYFARADSAVDETNTKNIHGTGEVRLRNVNGAGAVVENKNSSMLSPGVPMVMPLTPPASDSGKFDDMGREGQEQEEQEDREMFLALEKPRVRYDVEVVTKLVVYAGIAWLAVEGNPMLFEYAGLGKCGLAS